MGTSGSPKYTKPGLAGSTKTIGANKGDVFIRRYVRYFIATEPSARFRIAVIFLPGSCRCNPELRPMDWGIDAIIVFSGKYADTSDITGAV
jgi:hypothetical protein